MSYTRTNGRPRTTLIARRGYGNSTYSDLGATETHCVGMTGHEWDPDCTFNGIKGQCVPVNTKGRSTAYGCTYSGGGILSSIGSFLKGAASGALNVYGASKESAGAAEAYKQQLAAQKAAQGVPGWVVPVVIGGVGIAAVVLLMKRRR